ncbi:hypothetical protein MIR68_009839 [Amoeboaphelidium protococcarum]|nr:hypothetical protein MIR68_009839 [Amoeboaphelidium protococcarum]
MPKVTGINKIKVPKSEQLHEMMRVNQAGELGAIRIYQGQLAALKLLNNYPSNKIHSLVKHMYEQEIHHSDTFNKIIQQNNIRPTAMWPVWNVLGFGLGFSTALMGRRAAMLCTESVETVIGKHYNDQIRDLTRMIQDDSTRIEDRQALESMRSLFTTFRDEEMEHLDHAVANESQQTPFYNVFSAVIQTGCKVAIEVSKRI